MAVRLATLLPRAVVVALIWVLAPRRSRSPRTTTIVGPSTPSSTAGAAAAQPELVVPSVSGQAYVFAKGILEDSGFAWRVVGSVHGYSSNRVLTQSPAAGTRVVDTGAPTDRAAARARAPTPSTAGPSTSLRTAARDPLADLAAATRPGGSRTKPTAKPLPSRSRKPVVKPKGSRSPSRSRSSPRSVAPARVHARRRAEGAARRDHAAGPRAPPPGWARQPPEDRRERAHWLYQHAWIVTGAQFGWWHGAQALETLIAVDQQRRAAVGHRRQERGGRHAPRSPRSAAKRDENAAPLLAPPERGLHAHRDARRCS